MWHDGEADDPLVKQPPMLVEPNIGRHRPKKFLFRDYIQIHFTQIFFCLLKKHHDVIIIIIIIVILLQVLKMH